MRRRWTRGLRFRLTVSYALFLALLLGGVGAAFRHTLESSLDSQVREVLEHEWGAIKGYLRIEAKGPVWFFDRSDPDESYTVERLRRVYVLADPNGKVLQSSDIYRSLGADSPEEVAAILNGSGPVWRIKTTGEGVPFLIRAGRMYDERKRQPYFLAIGRSLRDQRTVLDQFTFAYLVITPAVIVAGCVLGWLLAGRALSPVIHVARTAERISGSNLSLRIPGRGAGDELDHLIDTFNRMIERLERSFQQARQFSTDVSHELRTPITVIRGQLEVALLTAATPEQYREAAVNSLQAIERLSQIVRALLLLSQAESGQLALQPVALDLAALLRETIDQFEIPAEEANVRLVGDLPRECLVEADRIQMERMFSNLLSNAIKFTPSGGEIRVELRARAGTVEIAVKDTGCGIPPEHLPHIFDRFYRVRSNETGPEKGLGLGLSFVAWIVKAHRGKVTVESASGKGACFRVSLPAPASAGYAKPALVSA